MVVRRMAIPGMFDSRRLAAERLQLGAAGEARRARGALAFLLDQRGLAGGRLVRPFRPHVARHRGQFGIAELLEGWHAALERSAGDADLAIDAVQQDVGHDTLVAVDPFRAVQRRKYAWQTLAAGLMACRAVGGEELFAIDRAGLLGASAQ